MLGELKPGQTLYVKQPYILVPDANSVSVFNPALSSATFVGEEEHPGAGIEAVAPPPLYTASAPTDTPGAVHLHWQAVPGAEGYEVFSTPTLTTAFHKNPDPVSSTPGGSQVTILPASTTDAYVMPDSGEPRWYAISTIVGKEPLLDHPVVEASGGGQASAEFGRCVKVAAGKGKYNSATCTSSGGENSYTWYPAFGSGKPLKKLGFTTAIKASTELKLATKSKKISCTGETSTGEYSGLRTVAGVALTLTGCDKSTTKTSESCQGTGAKEGEVVTDTLDGELGIIETSKNGPAENKIGLDLEPASGEAIAEFHCGSTFVSVEGSVIVQVTTDKLVGTETLKYTQAIDVQKPSHFEGGAEDVLQAKFGAASFEQMGLTLTTTQKNEETVEVNSVV